MIPRRSGFEERPHEPQLRASPARREPVFQRAGHHAGQLRPAPARRDAVELQLARHARHARSRRTQHGLGLHARRTGRARGRALDAAAGFVPSTQLEHARLGIVTPEMRRVAEREPHLTPEQVRDEVAAGRMVIPANTVHLGYGLDPMAIGRASRDQDQRQHGRLARLVSATDEEVEKLRWAERWGADTVMDLSTGGDLDATREAIVRARDRPDRHRADLLDDHRPPASRTSTRELILDVARAPGAPGRRLLHDPRRRAARAPAVREAAPDRHRLAAAARCWRSGCSTTGARTRCTTLWDEICDIMRQLRRDLLDRRRPAPRRPGRRHRRGAARASSRRSAS